MKRKCLILISFMLMVSILGACQKKESSDSNKLKVAVSIVPEATFLKAVAGDFVDVVTLIPPGSSPANYQPTPQQMTELSESGVYFSIGVPTEAANIIPNIESMNKEIKIVELGHIVDDVYLPRYFEDEPEAKNVNADENHEHEGRDPHIWMSPKRTIVMIEAIKDELSDIDPDHKEIYNANAKKYIEELKSLDQKIQTTMGQLKNKSFIIMHPSMGYFADDYGLKMIPLEEEGKEGTALRLQSIIDYAIKENIKVIFYQEEFDSQQAKTLASEIKGNAMALKPLSPNYIENLTEINNTFESVLK